LKIELRLIDEKKLQRAGFSAYFQKRALAALVRRGSLSKPLVNQSLTFLAKDTSPQGACGLSVQFTRRKRVLSHSRSATERIGVTIGRQ
jgi:hypothetical protein